MLDCPEKYTDLVNVVTSCPVCSKQHLEQLLKESEANNQSYQLVRIWQIDYIGLLPLNEGSKFAVVCMDCG